MHQLAPPPDHCYCGSVIFRIPSGLSDIKNHLARFSEQLCVLTNDSDYSFYTPGSATLIQYKKRFLLLCSRHQLGEVADLKDVSLSYLKGDKPIFVTAAKYWLLRGDVAPEQGDEHDIAIFDFTTSLEEYPEFKKHFRNRFFEFDGAPPECPPEQIILLLTSGFPVSAQEYDLFENKHWKRSKWRIVAEPGGKSADPVLATAKFANSEGRDPDGLSGAPVFAIQYFESEYRMKVVFAGMITRGGKENLFFLKSGRIQSILDKALL